MPEQSTPSFLCAVLLKTSLLHVWASEEAMTAVFIECHRGPKFDRTVHGRAVVERLFEMAWTGAWGGQAPKSTLADRYAVLAQLIPMLDGDFNLISQVAPNLLECPSGTEGPALQAEWKKLQAEFAARTDVSNPFVEKRPKIKVTAATHDLETFKRYVYASSISKAHEILMSASFPGMSHRITPFGRTPAFSDSNNFCQLPAVGDTFYKPRSTDPGQHLRQGFMSWGAEDGPAFNLLDDGSLEVPSLPVGHRSFRSESGGTMLQQSLASRRVAGIAWEAWVEVGAPAGALVIPRMNSVQVMGPLPFLMRLETPTKSTHGLTWTWDLRAVDVPSN